MGWIFENPKYGCGVDLASPRAPVLATRFRGRAGKVGNPLAVLLLPWASPTPRDGPLRRSETPTAASDAVSITRRRRARPGGALSTTRPTARGRPRQRLQNRPTGSSSAFAAPNYGNPVHFRKSETPGVCAWGRAFAVRGRRKPTGRLSACPRQAAASRQRLLRAGLQLAHPFARDAQFVGEVL